MDLSYHQPQHYSAYGNAQWSEDFKPAYAEREPHLHHEERPSGAATPADFGSVSHSRRASVLKVEDDYSAAEESMPMWHDRPHEPHYQTRHYSQPSIPTNGHHQSYMRVDPNFAASYAQPQWSMSHSGTSTPTPAYHASVDSYGQPVQVQHASNLGFNFNQEPISAVSMSPQSSQGGWASATSSDGLEQRGIMQSPLYRPMSPQLVLRPDGIRKKNARFEIPKERNLHTIDALIAASTDDHEKKELKQQKRLLRNRQAALDSRQRKKSHTEKLEHEKKMHEKRMVDLETAVDQFQEQLHLEREQWMHQRQQYDMQIKSLMQERDEAIRQKTIEVADTRRQLNAMKEYVREQSQRPSGYGQTTDMNNMASDFSEFGFDDDWENEFSLIDNTDLDTNDFENMQRQATPKPPMPSSDKKPEAEFSWNTFYMCLLFGAVVVSAGGQLAKAANSQADVSLPSVSDLNRADAENVLKAVLSIEPQSAQGLVPSRSAVPSLTTSTPHSSVSGSGFSHLSGESRTGLDKLSSTLTTPSRHQEVQQIFAMTPASYNHITDPLAEFEDDADTDLPDSPLHKPVVSRLEQALAAFNANKSPSERNGFQSQAHQQSALHVPEAVMADFRAFVHESRQRIKTQGEVQHCD